MFATVAKSVASSGPLPQPSAHPLPPQLDRTVNSIAATVKSKPEAVLNAVANLLTEAQAAKQALEATRADLL